MILKLLDYIEINGDKTFDDMPFNKVDSLVLTAMSYLKFDRHVPAKEENLIGINLKEISQSEDLDYLFKDERMRSLNEPLFYALLKSKRFGNLRLRDFLDIIDDGMAVQFCAMTVIFENGLTYVLFRGTDDNLVGWREDFNMMFKGPVPAQTMSLVYLEAVANRIEGDFFVGGHSKGGNLAIFSSSNAGPDIQNRIIKIFSHDGPGFAPEFYKSSGYENINYKIEKQVPQSSIFGLWLFTPSNYDIILSDGEGQKQHNPFNWYIDSKCQNDFIYADSLDETYEIKNRIFNEWVNETSSDEACEVIDIIFTLIENSGVKNMNDLNGIDHIVSAMKNFIHEYHELDASKKTKIIEVIALYSEIKTRESQKHYEAKYRHFFETLKNDVQISITSKKNRN